METLGNLREIEILTESASPPKVRLPLRWKVRYSTRLTVRVGRPESPILVVFGDAWAGVKRLEPIVREVVAESTALRFVVLSAATDTLPPLDAERRLLAPFPDLGRVELACGTAEMQRVLRTLIVKLQVLEQRNVPEQVSVDIRPPRPSRLDQVRNIVAATADLRDPKGNLSAERVAEVFGLPMSRLAAWLGRSRQALQKTPGAHALQPLLAHFERVARLRAALKRPDDFRKWLRMPRSDLDDQTPLGVLGGGKGQVVADLVEDMLAGSPT